ncbi:hypothetical protein GCM10011376_07350 [Nocardioides flavus (ex Wang et al. 2016)]|uniref:Lipoprotein n=1 Tax=Nocardioides flavus (ex Wang et al. 2016) TaxID=2058780 RepID=A0ABQ3HJS8_9ACTN|nr:hypothetical protein [Nocardioides flavus (ex Wang et al. 2016)]GHE16083.1 hypothetical protein GCM10011376_07350 [Nocardioides flavus (ex Wang et al. 2016)]
MRTIRSVAAAAALTVVTGCSVYEDFTTSDFAQQDGDAIVAAASETMREVTSLRVTGQVREGGEQYFVDLRMDREDRCKGTLRVGGSHIDIRRIGDRAWLKGEPGAFNRLGGGSVPRQVLDRLSRSWLQLDDRTVTRLCDFDALLAEFEVVDFGQRRNGKNASGKGRTEDAVVDGPVPATVVEETSLDGRKAVELSASPGGAHEERTWVLSEAPHHVVRMESTSTRDGGTISFSEFDVEVEVEAPPAEDVIRP